MRDPHLTIDGGRPSRVCPCVMFTTVKCFRDLNEANLEEIQLFVRGNVREPVPERSPRLGTTAPSFAVDVYAPAPGRPRSALTEAIKRVNQGGSAYIRRLADFTAVERSGTVQVPSVLPKGAIDPCLKR